MKKKAGNYLMTMDIGTSKIRILVFDSRVNIVSSSSSEFFPYYPSPGYVEYDLDILWTEIRKLCQQSLKKTGIFPSDILAVGVSTQRNTLAIWDRNTGRPTGRAIGWQDQRCVDLVKDLRCDELDEYFVHTTGQTLSFSNIGVKLRWIKDRKKKFFHGLQKGKYMFGALDTWLTWKLSNGALYITDVSSASTSGLFNIVKEEWETGIFFALSLERITLPQVWPSSAIYGRVSAKVFGAEPLLGALCVDQQASLFGHGCFEPGMAKCTLGTGSFLMVNLGKDPCFVAPELKTRIAWKIGEDTYYALEGMVCHSGSLINWLYQIGLTHSAEETARTAASVPDTNGVHLIPPLTGLSFPGSNIPGSGLITGLTLGTKREHLVRAVLETIVYQIKDIFEVIKERTSIRISFLRTSGGVSFNQFVLQFLADILQIRIEKSPILETTAFGTALLVGLSMGWWRNPLDIIQEKISPVTTFHPKMEKSVAQRLYEDWKQAVFQTVGSTRAETNI